MIELNVKTLLNKKGKSKYWLFHQMLNYSDSSSISYTNFNAMIENKTQSIKYKNIETLCNILDCNIEDLFTVVPDKTTK